MRYLFSLIAFSITCVLAGEAQTVDTAILGTVLDPGGAPVSGATVTILQGTTGLSRVTTTSQEGTYEARYLVPGEYVVETGPAGFRRERRTGVVIQLGQQVRIDFSLKVGTVQETLEVNAGVPLLPTENATIAGVVDQERVESLPINGRRFDDLAVLTPGVNVYNPDLHSSSTDGSEIGGNGGRLIWGQVNVDGITIFLRRNGHAGGDFQILLTEGREQDDASALRHSHRERSAPSLGHQQCPLLRTQRNGRGYPRWQPSPPS
jgi:hypothetical protein